MSVKAETKSGKNQPPDNRERSGNPKRVPPVEHRFKPGQSGNPGGRPKKNHLAELGEKVFADPKFQAALAKRLLSVKSDRLVKLVAEYTYGKPEQPITGDKDKPIEINVNIRKVGS